MPFQEARCVLITGSHQQDTPHTAGKEISGIKLHSRSRRVYRVASKDIKGRRKAEFKTCHQAQKFMWEKLGKEKMLQ